ncbi:MAG: YceI family protein [Acidobacteriota bacterium]
MRALVLTLLCGLLSPAPASAQSATWTIDPGHSLAQFTVRHMLVANVHGEFDGPTGTVSFDPARMADTLKIRAVLEARTINTRNAQRDRDLKSAGFFDVQKFTQITFLSTRVTNVTAGHFAVVGNLTMHGVTKEVQLDVEGPTAAVKDLDGHARIGATATTLIDRRDFGLRYNELIEGGGAIVGNDVRITIDLEMTR